MKKFFKKCNKLEKRRDFICKGPGNAYIISKEPNKVCVIFIENKLTKKQKLIMEETMPTSEELFAVCKQYLDDAESKKFGIIKPACRRKPAVEVPDGEGPSALEELMSMAGLDEVKSAIISQLAYGRIMSLRQKLGCKMPNRLKHMLFVGSPGTGKTTVARLIGRIYRSAGLLKSGQIVEVNRASLVGEYIGQTEKIVSEKLAAARGGILFIDEIYSLVINNDAGCTNNDNRDFGMRIVDTLMPLLSDSQSDIMVIGAGYDGPEMKRFIEANSGLASRFPLTLHFRDFTVDELIHIARAHLSKYAFELTLEADYKLQRLIAEASKIENFGNARFVMNLIENQLIPNLCRRLDQTNDWHDIDELSTIIQSDVPDDLSFIPLQISQRKTVGFRGNI